MDDDRIVELRENAGDGCYGPLAGEIIEDLLDEIVRLKKQAWERLRQNLSDAEEEIKMLRAYVDKTIDQRVADEIKAREEAVALANAQANELNKSMRDEVNRLYARQDEFAAIIDRIQYSAYDSAGEVEEALKKAFRTAFDRPAREMAFEIARLKAHCPYAGDTELEDVSL